jgi:hypothetical protein
MIDPHPALRAEHAGVFVAAVGDARDRLVGPVTLRLSSFTSIDMPNALPDWRWHPLQ